MEKYTIRNAIYEDAPILASFRLKMFQDNQSYLDPKSALEVLPFFEKSIAESLKNGALLGWMVSCEGSPIGCGCAHYFIKLPTPENPSGKSLYILNMFTLEAHRGKGVAGLIIETIKDYAREIGIKRVWLNTSVSGKPLYEKLGFETMDDVMEIFV